MISAYFPYYLVCLLCLTLLLSPAVTFQNYFFLTLQEAVLCFYYFDILFFVPFIYLIQQSQNRGGG